MKHIIRRRIHLFNAVFSIERSAYIPTLEDEFLFLSLYDFFPLDNTCLLLRIYSFICRRLCLPTCAISAIRIR